MATDYNDRVFTVDTRKFRYKKFTMSFGTYSAELKTMNSGVFRSIYGRKQAVLTFSGNAARSELIYMRDNINALSGRQISLTAEGVTYERMELENSVLTFNSDSSIGTYTMVFREVS